MDSGIDEITAVIVTYRREAKLANLLGSLRSSGFSRITQIVIIDDSPVRFSRLEEFSDLPIDYVQNRERGYISRAKNLALGMARGDFILFVDDDNIVGREALERIYETAASDGGIGAVAPSVLYFQDPETVWVYATPFRPGKWGFKLVGRNLRREPSLENRRMDTDALPNACLVRKKAVLEAGGFDEDLLVNSSADFCSRLKKKGWKVVADTGAFFLHDVQLPLRFGYWMEHQIVDPMRVFMEAREWFLIMKRFHEGLRTFFISSILHYVFVGGPNTLSFIASGRGRRLALISHQARGALRGYIDSFSR
ncbi:MAG: glycosyltransferase [Candidatus Thermoplasmatota archaeon]|nr:glycosyltransferase [Candidatus Thermoplasmatota archaeon]